MWEENYQIGYINLIGIILEFSVLLSLYDKENPLWLDNCFDSLINSQTLLPNEVVIVEDGPLNTQLTNILNKYQTNSSVPFNRIKLEENVGLGKALSIGLESCKFDLVARMDTDDVAEPTRFEQQVTFFSNNPCLHILGSSAIDIDESGNVLGHQRTVPEKNENIYRNLWSCPLIHPTVMFKKSFILGVGSYSTLLKRRQDYDLWFRCAIAGATFHNLQEPLVKYRVTSQSHKKNSFRVSCIQARIGLVGSISLKLGIKAYVGVFYPVLKSILPNNLRVFIVSKLSRFDPRRQ